MRRISKPVYGLTSMLEALHSLGSNLGLDLTGDQERRSGASHLLGTGDKPVLSGTPLHKAVSSLAESMTRSGDQASS